MPKPSSRASSTPARNPRLISILRSLTLGLISAILVLLVLIILKPGQTDDSLVLDPMPEQTDTSNSTPEDEPTSNPNFISLQPTVDSWLQTTSAEIGLMIYDLDNHQIAAAYQPNKVFNVASIYKLFFVYVGYQQIDSGVLDADSHFVTTNDYRAGNYTLGACLDLMIRESYNGCADPMRQNRLFAQQAETLADELNLKNTSDLGLYSTATDLTQLLQLYYEHPDLSESSWRKITDSMLVQPPTEVMEGVTYDWRQGLPAGFSSAVNVYDKVGWAWDSDRGWDVYADAAIVEFPELNRHYTVVVLSSGITTHDPQPITRLGQMIESAITSSISN